jgi:hypothetical protein
MHIFTIMFALNGVNTRVRRHSPVHETCREPRARGWFERDVPLGHHVVNAIHTDSLDSDIGSCSTISLTRLPCDIAIILTPHIARQQARRCGTVCAYQHRTIWTTSPELSGLPKR